MLPALTGQPPGLVVVDGLYTALGLGLACLVVLAARGLFRHVWPALGVVLGGCMLACLLPGLALAVWWPGLMRGASVAGCMMQGVCVAPAALWPLLRVLQRMPPTLARTARGLGADAQARLRLLWLPLLGGPLACVAVCCTALVTLCALAAAAWQ